jgi:hypothetical protein
LTATEEPTVRLSESGSHRQREVDRCREEIESAKRLLRAGHPDIEGLCLMLSDWSAELRLLEAEEDQRRESGDWRRGVAEAG